MRAARVRPCPWRRPVRHLTAPEPGDTLRLAVFATHPRLGAYFHAEMLTVRSAMPALRSEEGGLHMLLRWADRPPRSTRGRPRFHMVFSELLLPRSVCTATHALHTHTPPRDCGVGVHFRVGVHRAQGQRRLFVDAPGGDPGDPAALPLCARCVS